jgi:hypothetical protein
VNKLATLTTFRDQGFELTSGEIESLIQTERDLWTYAAERIHPRLQRRLSSPEEPLSRASTESSSFAHPDEDDNGHHRGV